MSPEEAIDTAVKAIIAADTGAGGLNVNTSAAYLRGGYFSMGDPNYYGNAVNAYPFLIIEPLPSNNLSPFIPASGLNYAFNGVLRFHYHGRRDSNVALAQIRAIDTRIITVFNDASLGTVSGGTETWTFCKPRMVGAMQVVGFSGEELHAIRSFGITASAS